MAKSVATAAATTYRGDALLEALRFGMIEDSVRIRAELWSSVLVVRGGGGLIVQRDAEPSQS